MIRGVFFTIILLYVSDMIIAGNNNIIIKELKRFNTIFFGSKT
jgi:hypothetical protein